MMARLSQVRAGGFDALELRSEAMALTMVPELGGKITSIRDGFGGAEWLWSNPSLPLARVPQGASYLTQGDSGGWDECFPTVAPCPFPGRSGYHLPDHGDLWSQPWTTETREGRAIYGVVRGLVLPYRFERTIALAADGAAATLDYVVTNEGDEDIPFIWSAHPIFACDIPLRVVLPSVGAMNVYLDVPEGCMGGKGARVSWPPDGSRDEEGFAMPPATADRAFKLWSDPLPEGRCALRRADGSELRLRFDTGFAPQVGLWINAGGWSGIGGTPYYNLALEPCIGAQDRLDEAVELHRLHGTLPARGRRSWSVTIEVRPGARAASIGAERHDRNHPWHP